MSDSLRPRGLQHARLLCPPMASVVRSNSRPLSRWYCQTISSPAAPFFAFSLSQHRRFPMSLHFASGGWSIGASASASVLPVSIQGWFPLNWFDLLTVQGHLKSLLQHHNPEASIVWHSAFLMVHLSEPYMTIGKTIALAIQTFVGKLMSLLFNTLSRFVTAFLSMSKCLLTLWLQSASTVILEPKKMKSVTIYTFSPSICHEVMWLDAMIFILWILSFKPAFSLSSFALKRIFNYSSHSCH